MKQNFVLALNAGSSSLKASLLQAANQARIMTVLGERLKTEQSSIHIRFDKDDDRLDISKPHLDHEETLKIVVKELKDRNLLDGIVAVGHRVVHGGTKFHSSTLVESLQVLEEMESVSHLAPLHNPSNLAGIRLIRDILPNIPNVAVFDTSFHSSIPEKAYTYPLPPEYRALQIRKYGFHGTSVKYVAEKAESLIFDERAKYKPHMNGTPLNVIVCHLGSGASVTAVVNGESQETSMGFTPLAGLMMGTRCGSVDPSIVGFACEKLDKTVEQVMTDFNKRSGLKGMAGTDSDMRSLLSRDDHEAKLAVDMFVYHLSQHIAGAMVALDGPLDAIIFTAGIGEHSAEIRRRTMESLQTAILPNAKLDESRNVRDGEESNGILSVDGSWPLLLDIPTDEEAMIAKESLRITSQ